MLKRRSSVRVSCLARDERTRKELWHLAEREYCRLLEQLETRMDEIGARVARDRANAARERTSADEAQRLTN